MKVISKALRLLTGMAEGNSRPSPITIP